MSRWLVSHIPPFVLLLVLVLVIAGGAVLLRRHLSRRFPQLTQDEHNDLLKFTYGFIGFVYAFLIGFVVSAMWGQINTADANARAEGAVAVQMARNTTVFDAADATRIRQSLLTYEKAAITEWQDTGTRRSAEADTALAALHAAYAAVQPTTDTQRTFLATAWSNLDKISQARTERILTAREDTGPLWPLWVVILSTSAMVLGTAIIYGGAKPAHHYPMVTIVGIVVATNLFLVLQLAYPYLGAMSTSSDPLQEAVWQLGQPAQ